MHDVANPPPHTQERELPTRWQAFVFQAKASILQLLRGWKNLREGLHRHPRGKAFAEQSIIGEWHSMLRGAEQMPPRELELQEGKVRNLRVAASRLEEIEVPANEVWSFWRQLGKASQSKGYAEGRELREGCIIPQIGGGLCQLSGAIYNAALEAGLEIVERHAHSNSNIGALARIGRDATVFWNYVDLRLRAPQPWRMEVEVCETQLHVRIRCPVKLPRAAKTQMTEPSPATPLNSCATCGMVSCHRGESSSKL